MVLVNEVGPKWEWGGVQLGMWVPLRWGTCPPSVMWGCRQCFATSIRPSVPLQTELKEQKCEATVGGERSPFPGGPSRGVTQPLRMWVQARTSPGAAL